MVRLGLHEFACESGDERVKFGGGEGLNSRRDVSRIPLGQPIELTNQAAMQQRGRLDGIRIDEAAGGSQ